MIAIINLNYEVILNEVFKVFFDIKIFQITGFDPGIYSLCILKPFCSLALSVERQPTSNLYA